MDFSSIILPQDHVNSDSHRRRAVAPADYGWSPEQSATAGKSPSPPSPSPYSGGAAGNGTRQPTSVSTPTPVPAPPQQPAAAGPALPIPTANLNASTPQGVLGLAPDANAADLKRRYRVLALRYHPDKNKGSATATLFFQRIQEAYEAVTGRCLRRPSW